MSYKPPKPHDPKPDHDPRPDPKPDADHDVDISVKQDMELSLKNYDYNKTEYDIKVYSPPKVDVNVNINETKNVNVNENHNINFTENLKKDIDVSYEEWTVDVDVKSDSIIQNVDLSKVWDEDVNDVDNQGLINVHKANLEMDDFTSDQLAIGKSFNGEGNDLQFHVNQSNELDDSDNLQNPSVTFWGFDGKKDGGPAPSGLTGPGGPHGPPGGPGGMGPVDAFQSVDVEGGRSESGDGIKDASGGSLSSDNDGDGTITGTSEATADAEANVNLGSLDIDVGNNQQLNIVNLTVVGNDRTDEDGKGGGHHDGGGGGHHDDDDYDARTGDGGGHPGGDWEPGDGIAIRDSDLSKTWDDDVNDLDTQNLINVSEASLSMDDFDLDITAIGSSFNGPGNDMQFDFDQVNDMVDQDTINYPSVFFAGSTSGTLQEVNVDGGHSKAGDGIGNLHAHEAASDNNGNGAITGTTAASANAIANVDAFSMNIVMGANVQGNSFTANVVGGDAIDADLGS